MPPTAARLLQHNTVNDVICTSLLLMLILYQVKCIWSNVSLITKSRTTIQEEAKLLEIDFVFSYRVKIMLYF